VRFIDLGLNAVCKSLIHLLAVDSPDRTCAGWVVSLLQTFQLFYRWCFAILFQVRGASKPFGQVSLGCISSFLSRQNGLFALPSKLKLCFSAPLLKSRLCKACQLSIKPCMSSRMVLWRRTLKCKVTLLKLLALFPSKVWSVYFSWEIVCHSYHHAAC